MVSRLTVLNDAAALRAHQRSVDVLHSALSPRPSTSCNSSGSSRDSSGNSDSSMGSSTHGSSSMVHNSGIHGSSSSTARNSGSNSRDNSRDNSRGSSHSSSISSIPFLFVPSDCRLLAALWVQQPIYWDYPRLAMQLHVPPYWNVNCICSRIAL